jgi:alkanesulfonate monooxygenase SsuD/methylene tetrahydromethanopterin reductase-like flavin-dependent oxidoreductase (luciferase family)
MAAGLAEISDGRFVLGVGAGWNEEEFRAFGLPFDHRGSRFEEAFDIVRRLLDGERVTRQGTYWDARDAVLLPRPKRRPSLMVGSNGPRVLAAALPHVDAWNTWFEEYGNTPHGFHSLNERITTAVRTAGRDPADVRRSACAFVVVNRGSSERPVSPQVPPVEGPPESVAAHLRGLEEAGADEVIVVATPIDERSIRFVGGALALLEGRSSGSA